MAFFALPADATVERELLAGMIDSAKASLWAAQPPAIKLEATVAAIESLTTKLANASLGPSWKQWPIPMRCETMPREKACVPLQTGTKLRRRRLRLSSPQRLPHTWLR